MTVSQFLRHTPTRPLNQLYRPRTATLVMLGILILAAAIVTGWFAGEGNITQIFNQLYAWQQNPPMWLMAPMMTGETLGPTIGLWLLVMLVMKLSPMPRTWSRWLVATILLGLTVRYVLWRSLSTLNLSDPLNGSFSLALFALEMLMIVGGLLQLVLMFGFKSRRKEADHYAQAVLADTYAPTVDVMIPTYNEPAVVLRRTIVGCQAMDYANKTIYLLDDTRRPEIQQLAKELGCEYLTRPDNRHAKAGNLNHALPLTQGELVVVFDADFIPTRNFLTRTVGFFQDPQIGLVQTPQSFYNADPIARNLGLENIVTSEEEVFYRQIQPIRDGAGGVICSGTSFVVRRQALQATQGFVTESLSEDYFTGIRLSALGYRLVYLDEKLSAGLAAENIAAHATQRLRWARGTLQAFFIDANPLTIRGLNLIQRMAHLEGLLSWFTNLSRVSFLLFPLAYSFLGVIPIQATVSELLYFFLPYYVVQLTVFSWLNHASRSALLSDIYTLLLSFPLVVTIFQVMLRPFSKGFKVTPKGISSDRFVFNWNLALPLMVLFILTAISLWRNLGNCMIVWQMPDTYTATTVFKGIGLGWLWSIYNLAMISIALLVLLDAPKPTTDEWFDLRRTIQITLQPSQGDDPDKNIPQPLTLWGITTMMSESGVDIALTQAGLPSFATRETWPVTVEILEEKLVLPGQIIHQGWEGEFPTVCVKFDPLPLAQHRRLIEVLFCRPGQWKRNCTPSEWQSLILLFRVLFWPKVVFDRKATIRALTVAKV